MGVKVIVGTPSVGTLVMVSKVVTPAEVCVVGSPVAVIVPGDDGCV